ncbi:MAG TPA: TonB-dependent receptor [Moheibacter sp.]|nr:TonB-dependent receptor [Moheibacter sp.]
MNKLLLSMVISVIFGIALMGQTRISGVVKDSSTEKEIYNLSVSITETGEEVKTDRIGYFQFVDVPNGTYTIRISGVGYQTLEQEVVVNDEPRIELGDLKIVFNPKNEEIGVITLTTDELSADETSAQSAAGLLQSSQDVFASTAAFELGAYWFKVRGYDNKYNDVFFNGVRMNKINNDRVNFGDWGGLNDVTRRPAEQTIGAEPSAYAFGDVGGVTYFDTRPSTMRKGTSLAYSFTDRSYNQRVLATYNTGLMENGWAFMGSGARRWAEEGAIEGTFYDSWAYFFAAEKKFNENHSLVLTALGAPTRRSTNSPNTQEVYDMMGKDYNAYWGWQDGEKRSERIRNFHQPLFMLTHHWNISPKSNLITSIGYQFGKDSRSRLDWFKANNPSPIYYRNLPSYYATIDGTTPEEIADVVRMWQTDQNYSQIDWTDIYNQNFNRKGGGAAYVLAADVNEDQIMTFSTRLQSQILDNFNLTAGLNYQNTQSELYREVLDLLGGSYFVNYNAFQKSYYNVDEDPNRKVYKGDKYQYHYDISHQRADVFVQGALALEKFDITLGMKAAYTSVFREGNYRHEQYLDNSKGKSKTYNFVDFGAKAQVLYKLNGRNFFQLNAMYASNAPTVDEIFPNARSNDYTIDENNFTQNGNNLTTSKVLSSDLSYILRAPRVKGRITGFYTKFFDEYEKNFGYIDTGSGNGNLFGAEFMYNVDKVFMGGELAAEVQLTTTLSLSAVASMGQFTYDNNPTYQRFSDSYAVGVVEGDDALLTVGATAPQTTYLENYRVATGPQQGYSLGLEYRDPHYWWIGATGNYMAGNYLDPAPYRRTSEVWGSEPWNYTDEQVSNFLRQEKFSDEFMLNLNAGKTFRFGKYYMGISANVNNVLNNRQYVTGGFEQVRIGNLDVLADRPGYDKVFSPRYWYDRGRSYFINVFFRF